MVLSRGCPLKNKEILLVCLIGAKESKKSYFEARLPMQNTGSCGKILRFNRGRDFQGKIKCAAIPQVAFHPDFSPIFLNKFFADNQAQACP